jgi:two-component system sensor histidine kinase TctE
VLVQVAETREKRSVLATEIIKGVMLPQFVILPLAVLLVWLALVRGIKPLSQLEERIRARKPDDLSPLDEKAVPLEVAPLVSSVNDLLTRLKDSIATQKRFLADAAHQLKTPLAGCACRPTWRSARGRQRRGTEAVAQADRPLQHARHPHGQPAAGAGARRKQRQDAGAPALRPGRAHARGGARHCAARAWTSASTWATTARCRRARRHAEGNPTLLKELIRNLVDNAINYTPSSAEQPGVVTARVLADPFGRVLVLQVEDSGPASRRRARAGVPAVLPRARHQRRRLRPGPADRAEIARSTRRRMRIEDARPGHAPPGTLVVRFTTPGAGRQPGALPQAA